jgi:GDP-4-dehydro-6-deoxy-D-mannose reductase
MKCLVTGAGGFIGGHLVECLTGKGWEVHAVDQARGALPKDVHFHSVDLLDREQTASCIGKVRPDAVFHLAAQSYPGASWEKPALTFNVNVLGSIHVLEGIRQAGLNPPTLMVCSSAEYAPETGAAPIPEDAPLRPSSPYGVSKLAEDHAARLYFEKYGLKTVRVRPFFLIGPRKTGDVSSDFARGIVAIERGKADHLSVGNLDVVRDLLDVRDGVEAFVLLVEKGTAGEVYNVCSGRGYSVREILATLKELSRVHVVEKPDPARLRPLDEMVRIGDPARLKALGWSPVRSIRQTLEDILIYSRTTES